MRALVLLGLAAACHGAAVPTPPPSPAIVAPPPRPRLPEPREVHLADLRQMTFGGENAEAYWSHDGKQLIFQSTRPPFACDQIFRMPVDVGGPGLSLVSTGAGRTTCAYFFPGDRHVLYASTHAAGPACPPRPDMSQGYVWALYDNFDIYRARADGKELENLTRSPGYDAEATVCARDGSIVFTSTRDGDIDLYRMDADGKNVKRLTHTPGYDGGAYFSPDCKHIVWRASRPAPGPELDDYRRLLGQGLVRPTTLEIWVANADGSEARQVTYLGAASFAPSWFPSGERIIFASNVGDPKGREFELWAVNANGTGLERITWSDGFDGFPMFSPDGTQLAFASNRSGTVPGETNVFVARWVAGEAPTADAPADRFYADVAWLADDAREGRGIGSRGLDEATAWLEQRLVLVRRFAPDGLDLDAQHKYSDVRRKAWTAREHGARALLVADLAEPGETRAERELPHAGIDSMGDAGLPVLYLGRAVAAPLVTGGHRARLEVALDVTRAAAWNVVGRLRGSGKLPGAVVVGAHVDHLGMGGPASLAPEVSAVHSGADDNASGVAALLEVARVLAARRAELARDLVLVAFSGEEEGDLGSTAFTRAPPGGLAMKDVVAMLNMDMVGRMRDDRVQVLGAETAAEWSQLVPPVCARLRIDCGLAPGGYGASDHTPFYAHGAPVLHFFTGSHRDYHKPTDQARYINAAGGAAVAGLVAELALVAAAQPKLSVQVTPAPQPVGDLRAAGASLGTVPDYAGPENGQPGVLLAGVRPGGPADAAGMKRGDILVAVDGHAVRTVEDFMYVLSSATPGAHGRVTVVRDGRKLDLEVVFGPPTRR